MASPAEQVQSMASLAENWDGYGGAAPQAHVLELAEGLVDLLEAGFRKSFAEPPVLHVTPTRIGGVLIEWEDRTTQREIDINPDGSISFLHLNRNTGHVETRKFVASQPSVVHPGFLRELKELLAA
jgi:hypothetical protein